MKSTELIKGKWYITALGWLVKYKKKSVDGNSTIITEYVHNNFHRVFDFEGSIYADLIYLATIDDFPEKYKYLFTDNNQIEPVYEIY